MTAKVGRVGVFTGTIIYLLIAPRPLASGAHVSGL
jgi:hypothetical protein